MTFKNFSNYLKKIEDISSRNDITIVVSELISSLQLEESRLAMYLIMGRIAPKFVPLEFNFSSKLIVKALDTKYSNVLEKYKKYGDLGTLIEELKLNDNVEVDLDISTVFEKLKEIAVISGSGSQENKINKYLELITQLDFQSSKYVTRIIVGDLRLGMSDKTILDSISWYVTGDKSIRKILDSAYGKYADLGGILSFVKELDNIKESTEYRDFVIKTLETIKLKPGVPVASKLVEREVDSESVFKRMNDSYVQPKLDGLRGQLHYSINNFEELDTNVAIYSRNMELMTNQFPELTTSLKSLGVKSIILDSEIIGVKDLGYATYQDTMKRRRKYEIETFSKDIPVKAMCFDILYLNGKDLTELPIDERLKLLEDILKNNRDSLEMLETKRINTLEELESYFRDKVSRGLEGIIVKDNNTNYEPGTRNFKWIKLKANTLTEMVDTIDVVVLGYYRGKGDRSRFGFGTLLAGVYNPEDEKYYTIGKVGSGFSEELMNTMYKDLENISTNVMPKNYVVNNSLTPDVWVTPKIIMEIIADEITRSPNHTAAINISSKVKNDDSTKGLSIRFPRMKIWNRVDRDYPNNVSEIIRMYELRKAKD